MTTSFSWIPENMATQSSGLSAADQLVASIGGALRPLACAYDGAKLAATQPFKDGAAAVTTGAFTCRETERVVGEAVELEFVFTADKGTAGGVGVGVAFDFTCWSPANYVFVPGAVYNGNRFPVIGVCPSAPEGTDGIRPGDGYCPTYPESMYHNSKLPLTFSDNPRLAVTPGQPSKIEMLTGNAATPALCFFSPTLRRGFILLAEQRTRFGDNGLFIEENAARDRASFVVTAPGVRELAARFGGFRHSGDRAAAWAPGEAVTLKFRLYAFDAAGIPDLLEKFMQVRKSMSGENQPRDLAPMRTLLEAVRHKVDTKLWQETNLGSLYVSGFDVSVCLFQLGWVGGMMNTVPMLATGDPKQVERVSATLDFVVSRMQADSGFFYGTIKTDGSMDGEMGKMPTSLPHITMTRKNGDALLWLIKHFRLYRDLGLGDRIKPEWEKAARNTADAFVKVWDRYGEFGQYLDAQSGEIVVFNSTAGASAISGLALAAEYFGTSESSPSPLEGPASASRLRRASEGGGEGCGVCTEYLRVAKAAATMYFNRDVVGLGLTAGHCGDISQDADCESALALLESLILLQETTGEEQWTAMARTVAALVASWVLSYDYAFPPGTHIADNKSRMTGAVWASVQNKTPVPGMCTASADCLFKLFRATGEVRWLDLLRDIQRAHTEATELPGKPTVGFGMGSAMERIQTCDAEGRKTLGNYLAVSLEDSENRESGATLRFTPFQSGWVECAGMLMDLEIPGLYVRPDTGFLYVFDHVEARMESRDATGVTLVLTNRTPYDTKVAVMAEVGATVRRPLGTTAYLKWPVVEVKAGQTTRVKMDALGNFA